MQFPSRQVATLSGHAGAVHCVTFSAGHGQYILTGCADRTIRLFNPLKAIGVEPATTTGPRGKAQAPSPGLIQSYSSHGYEVLDLAVTSDNARFASVGGDRQVFLWDVSQGKTLRRWAGHGARVNCVDFGGADASVVASGSFDATVRLWDCKSQSTKPIQTLEEARDSVSSLHVVEHEIVTGCVDGRVRIYDLRMGMVYSDVIGNAITSVRQTRDGNAVLVSTLDSTLRLMDKTNGQMLQSYTGHTNTDYRIRSTLGLNDAVAVSGSEDGSIFAWDVLEGTVIDTLHAHGGKVASAVAFNGNKREWASAGTDGTVAVWGMEAK